MRRDYRYHNYKGTKNEEELKGESVGGLAFGKGDYTVQSRGGRGVLTLSEGHTADNRGWGNKNRRMKWGKKSLPQKKENRCGTDILTTSVLQAETVCQKKKNREGEGRKKEE